MTQAILPTTLLAGVVLIVLATIGLGMRNPVLLRLGLRNTMRRPTQSLIIIAGLVLSTGLITTFVALPDSLNASTVADRLVRAGHVDESVTGPLTQDQITQALASLGTQLLATPATLRQDISLATQMRFLYSLSGPTAPIVLLPGRPAYGSGYPPMVVDATYLSQTTMPMYVRAQGYASDQQVWAAVRDHPGDVVMQYKDGLGLPTSNGFPPFEVDIPTSAAPGATYHRVTVIGIVAGNTYWSTIFLSQRTAAEIVSQPSPWTYYYFRFQPGVSANQVISDLHRALPLAAYNVTLSSLEETDQNAYTASLTSFLSSYLAMGLLFGAFSIGVITSRAVVERWQQIGMLRALGFSRGLIRRSFLLEASFLITLGLVIGTGLAWWLYIQIAHAASLDVSIPAVPVALLLIGSYLVAFGCIVLPAQRASHIPPAEALRYE